MNLSDLLYGNIPSLSSFVQPGAVVTTMPNILGGDAVFGSSGELIATTLPNLFGGYNISGADGTFLGSTSANISGGSNYIDSTGRMTGYSQANILGGESVFTADAGFAGYTQPNVFGGETFMSSEGFSVFSNQTVFGGDVATANIFATPTVETFGSTFSGIDFASSGYTSSINMIDFSSIGDYGSYLANFDMSFFDISSFSIGSNW